MIRRGEGGWVEVGRAFMVARLPETPLDPSRSAKLDIQDYFGYDFCVR